MSTTKSRGGHSSSKHSSKLEARKPRLKPIGRSEHRHWGAVYVRGLLLDGEQKSVEPTGPISTSHPIVAGFQGHYWSTFCVCNPPTQRITIDGAFKVFLTNRQGAKIAAATLRKYRTFTKQLTDFSDKRGYVMLDQFTSQLEAIDADESTSEAIVDWHY